MTISVVLAVTALQVTGFHYFSGRRQRYESFLFSKSDQVIPSVSSISTVGFKRRRNTISPALFAMERERETSLTETNGSLSQMETGGAKQDGMAMNEEETNATSEFDLSTFLKGTIFLGVDPSPDVIAIASIYFVEGALGLAGLAKTYLLKDELHLGPAELSALTGFFALPWTIKPLYGFLSDGVPLFGYRRRSYLILCGLVGAFSYTLLGNSFFGLLPTDGGASDASSLLIPSTVACLIVSSACIAFSDVVADGIVVEKSRESNDPKLAGGLQSICWGSAAIGGLLSAYFSGSLLEVMKPQDVFRITAVLPFLVASIAFLINEKPVGNNGSIEEENELSNGTTNKGTAGALAVDSSSTDVSIRSQMDSLWQAIKQPSIYRPALFLFLWQSTPTSDGAFFYFMTEDLGFGPEFFGRVGLVSAVASLGGIWLYNSYLKTKPIKDILFWSSIVSAPLGMSELLLITHANRSLGIPDGAFVFGDDVVLSVLGEIAFLPTLVLAARLCPPGVEAVLFATLMSINNGAATLGTEIGALLTKQLGVTESNFDNLGLLTVICNLSSLYPLLFIGWLDEVGSKSEEELEQEEQALAMANDSSKE